MTDSQHSDCSDPAPPQPDLPDLSSTASAAHAGELEAAADAPRIAGYQVTAEVGHGAMGRVWKAVQISTRREVAIKTMRDAVGPSRQALLRFEREIELAARLVHPNIVPVYESGVDRGLHYYAMQFVDGKALDTYVADHALPQRAILELVRTVCMAVQHAHDHGVIHRDLKPSNILVTSSAHPYVLDFGLARALAALDQHPQISRAGEPAGTPIYMSPEQAMGDDRSIDARTDVYSLGVILYKLLTGRFPHDPDGTGDRIRQRIMHDPVTPPRRWSRSISRELETLMLKALQQAPGDRYTTAGELARDIERYLAGDPIPARAPRLGYTLTKRVRKHRRRLVAGALALTVAAALAAYAYQLNEIRQHVGLESAISRQATRSAVAATRRRSASRFISEGISRVEAGDPLAAMVWFTEALSLQDDPATARVTPMRIADAAARTPVIRQVWPHDESVRLALFSDDGSRVATVAGTNAYIRRTDSGQVVAGPIEHPATVRDASFSRDGAYLVTACADGHARVWDSTTGRLATKTVTDDEPAGISRAAFRPDGRWIVTANDRGLARMHDVASGQAIGEALVHQAALLDTSFSPDGRRVVTASQDRTARVWDAATGRAVTPPMPHPAAVTQASFIDDYRIATVCADGLARTWLVSSGKELVGAIRIGQTLNRVPFGHDTAGAVVRAGDGLTRLVPLQTSDQTDLVIAHAYRVNHADISADREHLVAAFADGTARLIKLSGHERPLMLHGHTKPVTDVAFSPSGDRLVTTGRDGQALIWDTDSGNLIASATHGSGSAITAAAFSPDGERLLTAGWDGSARLWNARTAHPVGTAIEQSGPVNAAAFHAEGQRFIVGGTAVACTRDNSDMPARCVPVRGSVIAVGFSNDGGLAQAASAVEAVRWAPDTGRVTHRIQGYAETGPIYWASFSRNGRYLASAHSDAARVWDLSQPGAPPVLLASDRAIFHTVFDPSAQIVLTSSIGQARVWDARTGQPITPGIRHDGKVYQGAFSADGRLVATASADRTARVWDAHSGLAVTGPLRHDRPVRTVVFSPVSDGPGQLATASGNTARVWQIGFDSRPVAQIRLVAQALSGLEIDENDALVRLSPDAAHERWAQARRQSLLPTDNHGD